MIKDLTVEYRTNPIGLDTLPRFSWKLSGEKEHTLQTAYEIQVACGGRMVWDSGRVSSEQSILIPYGGEPLQPFTCYQVMATSWDNHGEEASASGSFETGILQKENWTAPWIRADIPDTDRSPVVFEKIITVPEGTEGARLYLSACGIYEAKIDGKMVGDAFFAPGNTSYHHEIQYQTYDVTDLLPAGTHTLTLTVGNGWFRGYLGFAGQASHYGNILAVSGMLRLLPKAGAASTLCLDADTKAFHGPIREAEFYFGETDDLTAERTPLGNAIPLKEEESAQIGDLISQQDEPVRVVEKRAAEAMFTTPEGDLVFDFGQNLAGIVEVVLPAVRKKTTLTIRHAETLDRDGNFYTENLRAAKSTDVVIFDSGDAGRRIHPHFTFHGFRYIAVSCDAPVTCENFTALALSTDMKRTGHFSCSAPLVNRLCENILWGQRSNFIDIPTDCPQRDERLGWTGDAQVFCSTAGFQYNTALFFEKWLRDMDSETTAKWGVPHVVPNVLGDQDGAAGWSDAAVIIPWEQYQMFGDRKMLEEAFPLMKKWVDWIRTKCGENHLWQQGFQYGDWLALDAPSANDRTGGTDKYLVANAFYANSLRIVRDAAEVLGREEESKEFGRRFEEVKSALQNEYITQTGRLVSETQTAAVLLLHFGLLPEKDHDRVLEILLQNLAAHRNHLTTGFLGTPYLCECLSENGAHDIASEVFFKEDFPGWLYAVKKGATTVWERWNSILEDGTFDTSGMNSLNHYAYGSIKHWLVSEVTGITPMEPAYRKSRIAPRLTKGMTYAEASLETPYGLLSCSWTCDQGEICVKVTVPANTTAVLTLPEREGEILLASGTYTYTYATKTDLHVARFSMDSTLGEVLAEPAAKQLFDQLVPGMLDNPMISFAYGMTLNELVVQEPQAKPIYEAVLKQLNQNS